MTASIPRPVSKDPGTTNTNCDTMRQSQIKVQLRQRKAIIAERKGKNNKTINKTHTMRSTGSLDFGSKKVDLIQKES